MVFTLLFFFILLKNLISVVSIRYWHLRALKQEFNEANARIFNAKVSKTRKNIVNLLYDEGKFYLPYDISESLRI